MYIVECVRSLSPAPVLVLGGGNGSIRKRRVVLCKHTHATVVCKYFDVCKFVFVRMHVHSGMWLNTVSYHLYVLMSPTVPLSVCLLLFLQYCVISPTVPYTVFAKFN